ncbi:MAG: GIY-YIG nuclease family protein [Patescibacteria group bacterium]
MPYFVYILKSLADGKLYIGQTKDLENRLERHNNRQVKATRSRTPLEIIHFETFETRTESVRRESYLKSLKNSRYLEENIIKTQQ